MLNLAFLRKRQHFLQVAVVRPKRTVIRQFASGKREQRNVDPRAHQPNRHKCAGGNKEADARADRLFGAYAIDRGIQFACARQIKKLILEIVQRLTARIDGNVCPTLLRDRELFVIPGEHDDGGAGGQELCVLHRVTAKAACAKDSHHAIRSKYAGSPQFLDSPVWCNPRIRKGGKFLPLQFVFHSD